MRKLPFVYSGPQKGKMKTILEEILGGAGRNTR
jgi:hypothetical protein